MSLIHDSLRKLETKQVKNMGSGFSSREASYTSNRGFSIKKSWMILMPIAGLALIIYAYSLLSNSQKQNELLLNDLKQMKQDKISMLDNRFKRQDQLKSKVIVQPPVIIQSSAEEINQTSQNRQKEITKLNEKLLNTNTTTVGFKSSVTNPTHPNLPQINPTITKTKSIHKQKLKGNQNRIQKRKLKKVKKNKLSVTQTRQLVNNLQMQIELKNDIEVTRLLSKLAQSSGKESLVYLRMNAYWSNMNNDNNTAVLMYKKILFQKPYDIQAGTNLALIEAKDGNISQAMKRLELLKNKYPANKSIQDYFNKIGTN